ncbi:MAG: class I SAM-dependent methyltransferase [Phycisphaerae bacterium]|nr:class I SAM-dependent methyltransferase [Phycisphaerae bacterium]
MTARSADRHVLYTEAVQNVQSEIDFLDRQFFRLRARPARHLREDFCGTAAAACEWVRRGPDHTALGLDLDAPTLAWARAHERTKLRPEQQARITLRRGNVLTPPRAAAPRGGFDIVSAMNFSYFTFRTRPLMLRYFRVVRSSLARDGVFFLDYYGGSDALRELEERRRCKGFTYVWDQHRYDPLSGDWHCRIHFEFRDGTRLRNAFEYHWRTWTIPELREIALQAGFRRFRVYWEGEDANGTGNGVFRETRRGAADRAYICYLAAER